MYLVGALAASPAAGAAAPTGANAISTVAGSDWVGDGGAAVDALLLQPEGVAADSAGNLYIADAGENRVRRVDPNGVIATIAGTGVAGFSGDGGPATAAQLNQPYGLALDSRGALYIADFGNARVRRVGPDGIISTVAGGGNLPAGGANDGAPAISTALGQPRNLAIDPGGNLYISDFGADRIYQLSPPGALTAIAGNGTAGAAGDNGPATLAELNAPTALAFDAQGLLYIADSGNHLIRRIKFGVITSIARAASPTGLAFDAANVLYIADASAGVVTEITSLGSSPTSVPITIPLAAVDVTVQAGAGLYASIANQVVLWSGAGGTAAVAGNAAVVAGGANASYGDNGPAISARLNHPAGVAMDQAGNLYIADRDNNRIRRVGPDGTIVTFAGTGAAGYSGDGGPAVQAQLHAPSSVATDAAGDVYIADTGNARIRQVTPDGKIHTAVADGLASPVYAIVDPNGVLYIADDALGKILTAGSNHVAIPLVSGLSSPRGLAPDPQGDLYYTEAGAARVSKRTPAGAISAVGTGWSIPRAVAVDSEGHVYVADPGLQQILAIDSSGNSQVLAGTGSAGFSGDGGAANAAQLDFPWDVAIAGDGSLLVADLENNRVREVSSTSTPLSPPPARATNVTVLNAASLAPGPIAPNMLLLIGGTGITPAQIPDTSVVFGSVPARILSADTGGILVLTPASLAGSTSTSLEIFYRSAVVATVPLAVADAAPALFADPAGQAAANNQDGSLNSASSPAPRGSIVSLYGTGFGISGAPVTAAFNNFPAQVIYAGPVAGYPGLFQINVQVPSGYLPTGDLQVTVAAGSSPTQAGVLFWID